MKPRLNQIIAVVTGKKTRVEKEFGELNKIVQKADLFNGFSRQYRPLKEDGETQPPENKYPQQNIQSVIDKTKGILAGIMDAIATQEYGNCQAKADIVVDGTTVLKDVPVTYLLYLEKQLQDLHTFVGNFPVLDPAEHWQLQDGQYRTSPVESIRTKKVQKPIVLYDATDKHPAQTQLITEDQNVGYWNLTKFSTVIAATEKEAIIARILKLQDAVKVAREAANNLEVEQQHVADNVLGFVFGK